MNLAETQAALKRGTVIVVLLIFTFYTGRFLIVQGINIYRLINPAKLPDPEAKYGKLPQLKMTSATISGTPQYILDTQSGKLPAFSDRLLVYPLIKPQTNLLSEQKVKQLAADLLFTGDSTKLTNSLFRWVDGANTRTLQADAVTKNFRLDTPPFRISNIVAATPSITENDAIESVKGFIKSKSLVSQSDFDNMLFKTIPTQVNLGQIRESKTTTTTSKLLKVDGYVQIIGKKLSSRSPDVKYKILGPNARDSLISFTTTNNDNIAYKYPLINFNYYQPDYANGSEYYLSPIQDVWNAIQSGNGVISYVRTRGGDYYVPVNNLPISKIEIRDIYIAYYMQPDYTEYLQPIYVFEGQITTSGAATGDTGDIVIYFPAVRGDFIQQ